MTAETAFSRVRRQMILRHAAGYVELGELLVDGEGLVPPSARRLLPGELRGARVTRWRKVSWLTSPPPGRGRPQAG